MHVHLCKGSIINIVIDAVIVVIAVTDVITPKNKKFQMGCPAILSFSQKTNSNHNFTFIWSLSLSLVKRLNLL